MTPSEKIETIQKNKEKCYLHITPNHISTGAHFADNYDTLDLYCDMEENTLRFAEREIVNLISAANYLKREIKKEIQLYLVVCSDDVDMLEYAKNPADYIMSKKDKIIAVYKYMKAEVICKYADNIYGYLYFDFNGLLNEFEKYDINFEFDSSIVDSNVTDFIISYKPNVMEDKKHNHKVKNYLYIK